MSRPPRNPDSHRDLAKRARFDLLRYANCWEDADVLCSALRPRPGTRMLSIASGGDNSFALAAEGAEVVAADLSPAQIACAELKRAAVRRLPHGELLAFLGVLPSDARPRVFELLEKDLPPETRAFWSARPEQVRRGFIHSGKFEAYFRLFRTRVVPLIHSRKTVLELLEPKDGDARRRFYDGVWDNLRWRLMFRIFFSRRLMGRFGRDPEFFRYVKGSVSARLLARARYALTVLPTHENPYLDYILTGSFTRALPRYLRPENFEALRSGMERIVFFRGPVEEAARAHRGGGFDGFNLSDIFEYLDPGACREVYGGLLEAAKPGARLAYWNMLAPRRCPSEFQERMAPLRDLSSDLFEGDLAFFYSAFVVEEVR